jgi:hypothetical protein
MQRVIRQVGERIVERKLLEVLADDETERVEEAREEALSKRARAAVDAANSVTAVQQEAEEESGSGDSAATTPPAITEMLEGEDCPVCSAMLASIAEMDEPRRTKGVAEYGEFRGALAEGEEKATAVLEDSEVLTDALDGVKAAGAGDALP